MCCVVLLWESLALIISCSESLLIMSYGTELLKEGGSEVHVCNIFTPDIPVSPGNMFFFEYL